MILTVDRVNRKVTHLVASTSRTRTHKVRQAAKYDHIKIVNQQWLLNSMSKWEKEDETPYLVGNIYLVVVTLTDTFQVQIHEQDKIREEGFNSSAPSSIHDSDESSEDSASEEEESDSIQASQEEATEDVDGVMPEDIEEGHSPIDDLKGFDWGEIDEELRSFMGSDSESDNDSGAESVASDVSIRSRTSNKNAAKKRKLGETTDEDNSEEESTLAKKQRISNSRSTGLKTVKTPNSMQSESSLLTPGGTGDEEGDDDAVDQIRTGNDDEDGFDDDLEADLMAEFAREEEEAKVGDDAGG